MKLRAFASILVVSALATSSTFAATIGVFGDPSGASCNISAYSGVPSTLWVIYLPNLGCLPVGPSITGAEYRLVGLQGIQNIDWLGIEAPNPNASLDIGDSFDGTGVVTGFPAPQPGNVILHTITLIILNPLLNLDVTLGIVARNPPTNPVFNCPSVQDATPSYFCVCGGQAFLNSSRNCTVSVEEETWSGVKNLFR